MIKNRGVLLVIILTFLGVGANYGVYTFITNLINDVKYPSVALAQLFIGIGSIISIIFTMKYIDKHLNVLILSLFFLTALTFILFFISKNLILLHIVFFIWGLEFGSLSSIFQTATAHQVTEGTAVANALQSSGFNFSIMIGSTGAGFLLDSIGVSAILFSAFIISILGFAIVILNQKILNLENIKLYNFVRSLSF